MNWADADNCIQVVEHATQNHAKSTHARFSGNPCVSVATRLSILSIAKQLYAGEIPDLSYT